ncbi:hypothetical protein [Microbacterium sp. PMB16]|uniref:hypothetical protein n=1 Tax=Microbacterium sp. PMB16 TaxID=3120157 RepID=UPI003F4B8B7C
MTDAWTSIADEFLHISRSGVRAVAVAGRDAERSRSAADSLAAALVEAGQRVERAHSADGDETALREEVIAPFRAAPRDDRVLIASGPATLLSETARGMWNFTLWQLAGDEPPHSVASALVDMTDPENPTRRYADFCGLPSSYGA